jgi:hypothetical protein
VRRIAVAAVAAIALVIAFVVWRAKNRPAPVEPCTEETLQKVAFDGGTIVWRKHRARPPIDVDAGITTRAKDFPCRAGESDGDCRSRAQVEFGPLQEPATHLTVTLVDGSAGRLAHAVPGIDLHRKAYTGEVLKWKPDKPGNQPGSGNRFKVDFDGVIAEGMITGPNPDGTFWIQTWCSGADVPIPGTKTVDTSGD